MATSSPGVSRHLPRQLGHAKVGVAVGVRIGLTTLEERRMAKKQDEHDLGEKAGAKADLLEQAIENFNPFSSPEYKGGFRHGVQNQPKPDSPPPDPRRTDSASGPNDEADEHSPDSYSSDSSSDSSSDYSSHDSPNRTDSGALWGCIAAIAVVSGICVLLAVAVRDGPRAQSENPRGGTSAAVNPPPPTARLEGIVYSYSKDQWAWTDQTYGRHYPEVQKLGFFNWLHWGAGVSWKGSHTITQDSLSLSIRDLALPAGIERDNASSFHMLDQWSDVGVGYYVELRRATFDDLALSKHILFFRTFVGDTPPALIQTALSLHPVSLATASPRFAGQWVGVYKDKTDETPFVMRITQDGSTLSGSAMDYGAQKKRSSIFGYVVGTSVTLLKRYADTPYAVSLVSREGTPNQMAGTWRLANLQGHWNATLEGAIDGAVDDLPVTPPALSRPSSTLQR